MNNVIDFETRHTAARLAVDLDSRPAALLDDHTVEWVSQHATASGASPITISVLNDGAERPVIRSRAMSVLTAHIQRSA